MPKLTPDERRKRRVRAQIRRKAGGRPRLSVFRSSKNIYAQIIDDNRGVTVAAASSLEGEVKRQLETGADVKAAETVGKLVGERALALGISEVVFDRGGYLFHGRVKAVADSAREVGLKF